MDCPHRQLSPKGKSVHCRLVDIGTPIRNEPCGKCQSEWVEGRVPTVGELTPTLITLQKSHAGIVERKPIELPPLSVRIMTALAAFAKFVKSGGKLLDKPAVAERLAICDTCPEKVSFLWKPACGVCGCWLAVKGQLPHERCPLGKWPGDKDKRPCGSPCGSTSQVSTTTKPATS